METKTSVPRKLFIAIPTYDGQIRSEAYEGLRKPTDTADWIVKPCPGSLLARTFNKLLHLAYNDRKHRGWNRWAMHHADIEAPPLWADVLMDEMDRTGADIISAVVAIKDDRGLTTTALIDPDESKGDIRRLTMKEAFKLPETFNTEGATKVLGMPERFLAINTGLMLINFDRVAPFLRPKATGPTDRGLFFSVLDGVIEDPETGDLLPVSLSEDWHFSREAVKRGLKIFATRKVPVHHHGHGWFSNEEPWGVWETDHGDNLDREQYKRLVEGKKSANEVREQKGWARIPVMA